MIRQPNSKQKTRILANAMVEALRKGRSFSVSDGTAAGLTAKDVETYRDDAFALARRIDPAVCRTEVA